jgi:hypothetical protein
MSVFGFISLAMLIGLAGVAIPIIIHLLNRKRFQVVDWGAMQFLQISETTRRRLLIEEILLLLLRMGLIAVLVIGLAGLWIDFNALTQRIKSWGGPNLNASKLKLAHGNRDVVLIFDGSYSMSYSEKGAPSAHEAAKQWATEFVEDLDANDSVAILQAKQQVVPVLETPTHNLERARDVIAQLPEPAGGCDWREAVQTAAKILDDSKRPQREIILLTDNQKFGWADETSLLRWKLLAQRFDANKGIKPRIWVVNVAPERSKDPPNWSLAPLRASQTVVPVGWETTFHTAMRLTGQTEYKPPYRIRLEIDGQFVRNLDAPPSGKLENGQVPLDFREKFAAPGSRLVSVVVEPDPPPEKQPRGYVLKDHLPGDNRQDFAIEVAAALPVLLVDGDDRAGVKKRGVDFLRDALAPAVDRNPIVQAKVVPIQDFAPDLLTSDMNQQPNTKPRVLVLSNVAKLSPPQQESVAGFLAAGGGVLVTLGDRVDAKTYNDELHRAGQGWLPARLDDLAGDDTQPERATRPLIASFFHPALDVFRDKNGEFKEGAGLDLARIPRWWKVSTPGRGSTAAPVASFATNDPFLVEGSYKGGRVILCTVPLDTSWRTNLTSLEAFVPLVHELTYYLAGARAAEHNLTPGQPIRYETGSEAELNELALKPPGGDNKRIVYDNPVPSDACLAEVQRRPRGPLVVYGGTRETGVYVLTNRGRPNYYVAQPDPRESDLTPCEQDDRERVAALVPVTYENDRERIVSLMASAEQRQDLWHWLLLAVVGMLVIEVWMTRRMVKNR